MDNHKFPKAPLGTELDKIEQMNVDDPDRERLIREWFANADAFMMSLPAVKNELKKNG